MQQASVEKFSDLIGSVYDCVIAPEGWTEVLDQICAEFGFATGALSVASLTNMKAVVNAVSGSDLAQMAQNGVGYGPDIIELWGGAERIQQYPLGEPIVQSQAVRPDVISSNRYYREWALPKGLFDAVAVGLVRDRTMVGNAIFSQHESAGRIDDAQVDGLRLLAPHIRRAVTISNLFDMKTVEANTFAATVEALTVGVVLADEDSNIVHTNAAAAAMLAAGDPIVTRHGGSRFNPRRPRPHCNPPSRRQQRTRRRSGRKASASRSLAKAVTLSSSTFCRCDAAIPDPV
jgi:PAS domain-containing protein